MISIELFNKKYLDEIFDLFKRSDSTQRFLDTWCGNNMTAVLAFDDRKLIGMLPLEKRVFCLGGGRLINILWISGAHVEPEYRGKGIGTTLEQKIKDIFFPDYQAIFVYRGDETCPAYRWYKKLGYNELLPIMSFKKEADREDITVDYKLWQDESNIRGQQDKIYACFKKYIGERGGYPERYNQFWTDKLKSHYYKKFYDYSLLALTCGEDILSYAFLGKTSMKDGIPRIDILEFVAPDNSDIKNSLYKAVMSYSRRSGLKEVRIQLSAQDRFLPWIKSLGFVSRWRFNMMARLLDPVGYLRDSLLKVADLKNDYQFIVQTPGYGEQCIGTGKKSIKLFLSDNLLHEILLCRCNIANAVEEGRLVVLDGDESNIHILEKCFPLNKWQYFQIDYI